MTSKEALTAVKRFGLGARPGELASIASDPRSYVLSQLKMSDALTIRDKLPATSEAWKQWREFAVARKRAAEQAAKQQVSDEASDAEQPAAMADMVARVQLYQDEVEARIKLAVSTNTPFLERLVGFWANHFCVSSKEGGLMRSISGAYEREAIRPHVLGRFRDMLHAVAHHPAMLRYLDNDRSVGPNSPAGRRRGMGLNENLAREILELHTLGVGGGYSQADVTNFARALTGWMLYGGKSPQAGDFVFYAKAHEPGSFTILGREYGERGIRQAEAVLDDLAAHPATAKHIARKLAVNFVGDKAPQSLIDRLAREFRDTDGDLAAVAAALASSDEAWAAQPVKVLPPYDLVVSVFRASQFVPKVRFVITTLNTFGQPMWGVESPAGWPQGDEVWAAPDAMLERIDWAGRAADLASNSIKGDVVEFAYDILGDSLSGHTRQAIERAESRQQALVLLFLSPEFQRR